MTPRVHIILGPLLAVMLLLTGMTRAGGGMLELAHGHQEPVCDHSHEHQHHHRWSLESHDGHGHHEPHAPPHVHIPEVDSPGPRAERAASPAAQLDLTGTDAHANISVLCAPPSRLKSRGPFAVPLLSRSPPDILRTTRLQV